MRATYNIGVEVCDRWADLDPRRTVLLDSHADGRCDEIGYGALPDASNRLANALRALGVMRADPVAVPLPPGPEVAVEPISPPHPAAPPLAAPDPAGVRPASPP